MWKQLQKQAKELLSKHEYISAWDLRELGFELDPSIPDCASVSSSAINISFSALEQSGDGKVDNVTMGMTLEFTEPFEWHEVTIEMDARGA